MPTVWAIGDVKRLIWRPASCCAAPAAQERYAALATAPPYLQIVTAVVQKNLRQVIERIDLVDWKARTRSWQYPLKGARCVSHMLFLHRSSCYTDGSSGNPGDPMYVRQD